MQAVWGVKVRILATVLEYQRVEQKCISPQKVFAFFVVHVGQGQYLGKELRMEKRLKMNASSLHKRLEAVTY